MYQLTHVHYYYYHHYHSIRESSLLLLLLLLLFAVSMSKLRVKVDNLEPETTTAMLVVGVVAAFADIATATSTGHHSGAVS